MTVNEDVYKEIISNVLFKTLERGSKKIRTEDFVNSKETVTLLLPTSYIKEVIQMDKKILSKIPVDKCPCQNNCCEHSQVNHTESYSECGNCFMCCHCNS